MPENDPLIKPLINQLKKTKAEMSIWDLITGSVDDRTKVVEALMTIRVSPKTSPDALINLLTETAKPAIAFTTEDLPPEAVHHQRALYLTVQVQSSDLQNYNVPMTLVDPGSAINVCPLRTAKAIGVQTETLAGSSQEIRAYDGSRKTSLRTIKMKITTGPVQKDEVFHVVDIRASFNILLG